MKAMYAKNIKMFKDPVYRKKEQQKRKAEFNELARKLENAKKNWQKILLLWEQKIAKKIMRGKTTKLTVSMTAAAAAAAAAAHTPAPTVAATKKMRMSSSSSSSSDSRPKK